MLTTGNFVSIFFFVAVVFLGVCVLIWRNSECDSVDGVSGGKQGAGKENQLGDSGCVSPVPEKWEIDKTKAIKPDTIFVSIASYRDVECRDTVYQMFEAASNPDRIFAGVVQQNKLKEEDCFDKCPDCKKRKDSGHIKVLDYDFKDAKGPCFARYQASKLWDGEAYYLQIDSHTKFVDGWDDTLLEEFKRTNDPKAVISGYPPTEEQLAKIIKQNYNEFPMMCETKFNKDGLPQVTAKIIKRNDDNPVPVAYGGAGLLCMPAQALLDVNYDPYLNFLFFGEELLHSARLWTSGYNFYAPLKPFISHYYSRKGAPKFWDDNKEFEKCRQKAIHRVKYILGLGPLDKVEEDFRVDIEKYGLGKQRSMKEYWKFMGVDFDKKDQVVNRCTMDGYR